MMDISAAGIHAIANHEGFRAYVYDDKTGKPWESSPKQGFPTIGYGHLIPRDKQGHMSETYPASGITRETGEKLFKNDLTRFVAAVNHLVKVPISQNQFDALVSLVYNIGEGAFKNSTLLRMLNAKEYTQAAEHFLDWRYDAHHQPVLLKRRQEERALFLKP